MFAMPAEQTNIKVVVRVRPYNKRELEQNQRSVIKVLDEATLLFDPDSSEDDEFFFQGMKQNYRDITKRVNKKLSMDFDRVFNTDNTNTDIFDECTSPLVDAVLDGYNCSVFVYGATGAGKTFTMLGSDTSPGLTFLTMRDLFEKIQAQQDARKFDVGVSYLEVYNEHVMNLLTKSGPLKLREDANGVIVSGLVLKPIYSAEELLRLLALGNSNRTQHPTDANAESSRSHAIFQVHIRMTDRKTDTKRTVKLSMIDLAGSERAASTKGIGLRFKEGASINKSLLALGNCINKLADGLKHIPYRDSNLTRILKDSLGGNCRTLMVANISMSSLTYEDTYNTLKYASRAKKIRTTLRQNTMKSNMPKDFYVKKVNELIIENERLTEQNKNLQAKLALQLKSISRCSYDEAELKPWYSKIDAVYSSALKTQEYVIGIRSEIKRLDYRQSLKEDFENFRKILTFDQSSLQEDFVRLNSYITTLTTQKEKQMEELPRWRKKLHDALKDLEKLRKEVKESKHAEVLQIYQNGKDLEIQNSKQNIYNNHLTAINMELVENSDILRKAFTMGCEVLQQIYDSLESTQKLTPEIQKKYLKLQRHMRFKLDDTNNDGEAQQQHEAMPLNGKRVHSCVGDAEVGPSNVVLTSTSTAVKRSRESLPPFHDFVLELDSIENNDSDGVDCSTVEIFKRPRNLNETQILSCTDDSSSVFELSDKLTTTSNKMKAHKPNSINRQLVADILSENNVRMPASKEKLQQALLKSSSFNQNELHRTMAVATQKENIKLTNNIVRKSPRALVAKALSSTSAFVRKQTTRVGGVGREAPIVRINRAASFRVKK